MKKSIDRLTQRQLTIPLLKEIQNCGEKKISDMYGRIASHETVDKYIKDLEEEGFIEISVKRGDTRHLAQYCHLSRKGYIVLLADRISMLAESDSFGVDADRIMGSLENILRDVDEELMNEFASVKEYFF